MRFRTNKRVSRTALIQAVSSARPVDSRKQTAVLCDALRRSLFPCFRCKINTLHESQHKTGEKRSLTSFVKYCSMQDCNQTVLLYNGQIYLNRSSTLNQQQPAATAQSSLSTWLLIRGGFIVAIGDSKQPDPPSNPGTGITRVDLKGACVLPGLQDAHIHVQLVRNASLIFFGFCPSSTPSEFSLDKPWRA